MRLCSSMRSANRRQSGSRVMEDYRVWIFCCVTKQKENDESAESSCKTRNFLNCDVIISDSDKQTKETR